jgi:ribonuclease HI
MRLYFDGSATPRGSGAGFVLINDGDEKPFESNQYFLHKYTNNQAEYTGLIEGMKAALKHTTTLKVYGDSQLVIRQMMGQYQVRHPRMIPLYKQAMELATQFTDVEFHYIPRELNTLADALAQNAARNR